MSVLLCLNHQSFLGIDADWNLVTIPIAFQHVKGSHTGAAIKSQFNAISNEWGFQNKIFKIVTDQAANMKNAFADAYEAENIINVTKTLMLNQERLDRINELKQVEIDPQKQLVEEITIKIDSMNQSMPANPTNNRKR